MKADLFPGDEKYKNRMEVENAHMDDTALRLSVFGQRCFYNAFAEFDDQDIEMSLNSANLIVRIFAVLDRRVGKRRLTLMKKIIQEKSDTFQESLPILWYPHTGILRKAERWHPEGRFNHIFELCGLRIRLFGR